MTNNGRGAIEPRWAMRPGKDKHPVTPRAPFPTDTGSLMTTSIFGAPARLVSLSLVSAACAVALSACGGGGGGGSAADNAAASPSSGSTSASSSASTASAAAPTGSSTSTGSSAPALTVAQQTAAGAQKSDLCLFGDSIDSSLEKALKRVQTTTVAFVAQQLNSQDQAATTAAGVWHNFEGSAWLISTYESVTKYIIGVPIIPASNLVSMQGAAQGQYQSHYTTIAKDFASSGKGDAWIRVGWEFQGDWYPWGFNAQTAAEKARYCTDYIAAFRNVVSAFRAVSPNFKFVWNPNLDMGYSMPSVPACYPGDDVVDSIGLDVYDSNYNNISDPTARFNHDVVTAGVGLNWLASFAAQHNKTISFPEWGVGKVADNPTMINLMASWFSAHNVAKQCYWNGNADSGYQGNLGDYPGEMSAFVTNFGANPAFTPPTGALFVKAVAFGNNSEQADGIYFKSWPLAHANTDLSFTSTYQGDTDTLSLSPYTSDTGLETVLHSYATNTSNPTLSFSMPMLYSTNVAADVSQGGTEYYVYLYTMEPAASGSRSYSVTVGGTHMSGSTATASSTSYGPDGNLSTGNWMRYGPYTVSVANSGSPMSVSLTATKGSPVVSAVAVFRKG